MLNGTQQFTVKDSNLVNRTEEVTYTLSGDAAEGSSISEVGLLTVGTKAGDLTVTAKYTVDNKDFTANAIIEVSNGFENLITTATATSFIAYEGWNDAGVSPTGSFADGWELTTTNSTDSQWKEQLKVATDASLAVGDEYYFSVDIESTVDLNNVTVKFDDAVQILYDPTNKISADKGVNTIIYSGTVLEGQAKENILIVFDFGGNPANTVKVSNLVLAKK